MWCAVGQVNTPKFPEYQRLRGGDGDEYFFELPCPGCKVHESNLLRNLLAALADETGETIVECQVSEE